MGEQSTSILKKRTITCGGKLIDLSTPVVMGIINVTPDSFFDGGKHNETESMLRQAEKHLSEGATLLDVGAVSTRPNAQLASEQEERDRLLPAIAVLKSHFPDAVISVDTFRASIAREAADAGVGMINDISGGTMDGGMFQTVASLQLPYVLTHIQGRPENMQENPRYDNVVQEVLDHFIDRVHQLRTLGVHDIIVDPGFGFGKTVDHNYEILAGLRSFEVLNCPILCGFSRKGMVYKVLGTEPESALNGTTVLNTMALERGASILRVHDVKETMDCVKLNSVLSKISDAIKPMKI